MLKFANTEQNKARSSARVVDGKLILSFPGAVTPVVWQMDLGHAKASALEVVAEEAGQFSLTLKTPKGDQVKVATFISKADAVSGLMSASHALQNAHGKIAHGLSDAPRGAPDSGFSHTPANDGGRPASGRMVSVFLGILMLVVLITIWVNVIPRPPANYASIEGRTPESSSYYEGSAGDAKVAAPVSAEPGVPVSADAFLSGQ